MPDRIPTLVFHATGEAHWKRVTLITALHLLRAVPGGARARSWPLIRGRRSLEEEFRVRSYMIDWREAFCRAAALHVDACDLNNLLEFHWGLRQLKRYPLAVVLHSATGDNLSLLQRAAGYFQDRRGRLVVFVGNEFTQMPAKLGFITGVRADYVASQLPRSAAEWLYAGCTGSTLLLAPHALNPEVFRPQAGPRPIDLGFRGDLYPQAYLGDADRTELLRAVAERAAGWGLTADIQYRRCPWDEWSRFLSQCKGIVGTEAGTYYLEQDDRTQQAVKRFLEVHPEAGFQEVYDRFFRHYPNPVSGKAVSSRHFEAAGTKTCQLLLEGSYNGILKPHEHYIPVKRDLSNLDGAVRQFQDEGVRRAIVDRAYDHVMGSHTYQHRVQAVVQRIVQDGLPGG